MKEGQYSERKGPGKGRSPVATLAPLCGPGREGRRLRLPLGPRHSTGLVGPATGHDGRITGAISSRLRVRRLTFLAWKSLYAPFLDHEYTSMHARGRDRSLEERCARRITAAEMRLHSLQVCLITRSQTWLF